MVLVAVNDNCINRERVPLRKNKKNEKNHLSPKSVHTNRGFTDGARHVHVHLH